MPWRQVWTSLPFWAILVANFANNWGFHLLMTELPLYLSHVFPDYMNSGSRTGLWTAVPYGTMWVVSVLISLTTDHIIRNNLLSSAVVRKCNNTLAHLVPTACLLMIVILVTNSNLMMNLTLVMFTVGVGCMGANYSGWISNTQDIAPNFAGTILGVSNSIGAIPGFVAPRIAGQIVNSDPTDVNKWRIVWIIAIVILVVGSIFFIVFAAGAPQIWNFPIKEETVKRRKRRPDWFLIIFTLCEAIYGLTYAAVIITSNALG